MEFVAYKNTSLENIKFELTLCIDPKRIYVKHTINICFMYQSSHIDHLRIIHVLGLNIFFKLIQHCHEHLNSALQYRILSFGLQSLLTLLLQLQLKMLHCLRILFKLFIKPIYFSVLPKPTHIFSLNR